MAIEKRCCFPVAKVLYQLIFSRTGSSIVPLIRQMSRMKISPETKTVANMINNINSPRSQIWIVTEEKIKMHSSVTTQIFHRNKLLLQVEPSFRRMPRRHPPWLNNLSFLLSESPRRKLALSTASECSGRQFSLTATPKSTIRKRKSKSFHASHLL